METIAGFPFTGIEFTKDGAIFDDAQVQAALSMLDSAQPTDVLVLAHGWNNDMADAKDLYTHLLLHLRSSLDADRAPGADRGYAVVGVFWPSKKFADKDLIPSGAAGVGSAISDAELIARLEDLKGVFSEPDADTAVEHAQKLVPSLEDDPNARRQFADLLRSVVPRSAADEEDATDSFFALGGEQLMQQLSMPVLPAPPPPGQGGGAARLGSPRPPGGAAGLGRIVSGIKGAALNLLNFTTYYQMKQRSGVVGAGGVYQVLQRIKAHRDVRLHLCGHSFGGRLVTAAATGPEGQPAVGVQTVTLLQAAYSHYGLAHDYEPGKDGFFRRMVTDKSVTGPVLITHSVDDTAVGIAYPLASLIAGQVAAKLGDKNDRYGGMGRNGAQKTPEAVDGDLLSDAHGYAFGPGRIFNLKADGVITSHSDICRDQVADAVLTAIATT